MILEQFQAERPLMGTRVVITLYAPDEERAKRAFHAAFQRGDEINRIISDEFEESELRLFNRSTSLQRHKASFDFLTMVAYGIELAELTEGTFDPTIGALTQLWRKSLQAGQRPTPESLERAKASSGWDSLLIDLNEQEISKHKAGLKLDLDGLSKGYAIDQMLDALRKEGVTRALIVAGNDVRCGDSPPDKKGWSIGLQDQEGAITEACTVSNLSISTSDSSQRFITVDGTAYSHIIDPKTGIAMNTEVVATVIAPNGLMSDSLATVACLDPDYFQKLSPSTHIHSRILTETKRMISDGFPVLSPIQEWPSPTYQ